MKFELELHADDGRFSGHMLISFEQAEERVRFSDAMPAAVVGGIGHVLDKVQDKITADEKQQLNVLAAAARDDD